MLPSGGAETAARLTALRGRRATAVVWAQGADHRPVVVTDAPYDRMQREARAAAQAAGRSVERTLADIAPIADPPTAASAPLKRRRRGNGPLTQGSRPDNDLPGTPTPPRGEGGRRTVLLASAPADEVAALVQPLLDAGIRVDHLLTPAAALLSLARTRRSLAPGGGLEAYVALDEAASSVALVRDGSLVAATGLSWGFVEECEGHRSLREREEIAARLAGDLSAFLDEGGLGHEHLQHVCIASGVPDLRSMAMTLTELLDVETEPLDSLFAIDGTRLPDDADDCREHVPALRLAWAAAADPYPPLDLLRPRHWCARRARLWGAAVMAGAAAGLALGLAIQDRLRPGSAVRPISVLAASALPLRLAGVPAFAPPNPAPEGLRRGEPTAGPTVLRRPEFRPGKEPAFAPSELRRGQPDPAPSELRRGEPDPAPAAAPRRGRPVAALPARPRSKPADAPPTPPTRSNVDTAVVGPTTSVPLARIESATDAAPLPFEATLESILVGLDRRFALIDGRIVEAGDVVRGARVVEITATAVLLRDEGGRLRRLTGANRRP